MGSHLYDHNIMKIICLVLLCASLVSASSYQPDESPVENVVDFLKGFFEAMNEQHKFDNMLNCIKGSSGIVKEYIELWNKIKTLDPSKIMEIISLIVPLITKTIDYVKGCSGAINEIYKLIDAITSINIMNLVTRIIGNIPVLIKYVTELITAATSFDAGKALGHIVYKLILDGKLLLDGDNLFEKIIHFIEGFFEKLVNKTVLGNITECLEKFPEIQRQVMDAIEKLRKVSFKDIIKLIEGLMDLFRAMLGILEAIKPCSKFPAIIETMIHKFKNLNVTEMFKRITENLVFIIADLTSFANALKDGNFRDAGKFIGDVVYIVIYNRNINSLLALL